jgi:PAS domain S-box-containing protein
MPPDAHYRELFEALDQGFCTIEVLFDGSGRAFDYRFVEVNAAFEEQTGLNDAVGRTMRELAPSHEDHWYRAYGDVALTGAPVRFEQEAAALQRWFEVYAFRVGAPTLRQVGVLFRDITARRRTELELDEARRESERAARAKDEFMAMLGHELRNPLAPIVTALQLMRLRSGPSRELDVLERQVHHLTRMVDDLLDVSRITHGTIDLQRKPIELYDVVTSAIELAGPLLDQRQHIVDVQVPPTGAGIDVDHARMAQVLSNLLSNAAKYSDPKSRIVLRGARHEGIVRVTVGDEGIGLAPDMIETVFEPFVQQPQALERAAGGLGLGLAIVRSLVTAHGGRVWATSGGSNQGSEFTIELPAVTVPSPEAASSGCADRFSPGRPDSMRNRVLVVDDNYDAAEMLRTALEQFGYVVDVAHDGLSALVRAGTFHPTTVLLDIGLPVMDGYEVARRLRADPATRDAIQLVAITGYGQDTDREHAHDAGFDRHLVKPVDLEYLRTVLENARSAALDDSA